MLWYLLFTSLGGNVGAQIFKSHDLITQLLGSLDILGDSLFCSDIKLFALYNIHCNSSSFSAISIDVGVAYDFDRLIIHIVTVKFFDCVKFQNGNQSCSIECLCYIHKALESRFVVVTFFFCSLYKFEYCICCRSVLSKSLLFPNYTRVGNFFCYSFCQQIWRNT